MTASANPLRAMVLAAGLGTRMRPLTDTRPKPLVEVNGRALVDHVLDRLAEAGVRDVVVNVHHHADMLEKHVKARKDLKIHISDEREQLLDSGGGVKKALPLLVPDYEFALVSRKDLDLREPERSVHEVREHRIAENSGFADHQSRIHAPFFIVNADTIWIEGVRPNLARLAQDFDPARMDALLLLAPTASSIGYDGRGDFDLSSDGALSRRVEGRVTPFVYAGAAVLNPTAFAGLPEGAFSLNRLFDRAIENGRLYGLRLDGVWMHVGTPEAIHEAEECTARSAA